MSRLRVLVWNVEWARPQGPRGREIRHRIEDADADVVCITEGFRRLLPEFGHVVESDPDYGYPIREGRRKVILWSREPWKREDGTGPAEMPEGRYVHGATCTPSGMIEIYGVCIPWRDAHVRTGRRDRTPWEDHQRYLRALASLLRDRNDSAPAVVLGDFNQRIPRKWTPLEAHRELTRTFEDGFSICTAGEIEGADGLAIDHVAHTHSFDCRMVSVIPKVTKEGRRLSDHFGLVVDLAWVVGG